MCQAINLSTQYPIDTQKAINALGGETKIYFQMLDKFEPLSLLPTLEDLRDAVNEKDYTKIKNKAHSLKGASGYVGAGGIHYSCYHIQENFLHSNYHKMLEYYPTLIEQCINYRFYSRKKIAEFSKKEYEEQENLEKVAIANGYRIAKFEGQYYCLYDDITVAQRIVHQATQIMKPQGLTGSQSDGGMEKETPKQMPKKVQNTSPQNLNLTGGNSRSANQEQTSKNPQTRTRNKLKALAVEDINGKQQKDFVQNSGQYTHATKVVQKVQQNDEVQEQKSPIQQPISQLLNKQDDHSARNQNVYYNDLEQADNSNQQKIMMTEVSLDKKQHVTPCFQADTFQSEASHVAFPQQKLITQNQPNFQLRSLEKTNESNSVQTQKVQFQSAFQTREDNFNTGEGESIGEACCQNMCTLF